MRTFEEYTKAEKDYFEKDLISSSFLKSFDKKDFSKPEPSLVMQTGHIFELYLYDILNGTKDFEKKYYKVDEVPNPYYKYLEDPDDGIKRARDKETKKLLDDYKDSGLIAVSKGLYCSLDVMAENLLSSVVILENEEEIKANDLLSGANYQTPIYYGDRKGLIDFHKVRDGINYIIDIKTTEEVSRWAYNYKWYGGWIQDRHYIDLMTDYIGGLTPVYDRMIFLVVQTKAPFIAQPHQLGIVYEYNEKYNQLLRECREWILDGKPEFKTLEQRWI